MLGGESRPAGLRGWLLEGQVREPVGPHEPAGQQQHAWWRVMCLTGVDYFSTLGYQPGIAALAAGALSPLATLVLVLITLFGALPMYRRVAQESPHGDGSISMLERLLLWWQGKLFVLCLIGFVATGFIITITLSAADAAAHIIENPLVNHALDAYQIAITLLLIALLGAVFFKGFREAIGIAVLLVALYIVLNLVVVGRGLLQLIQQPQVITDWSALLVGNYGNPLVMLGAALLLFPKLALGLSGFETGVVVMPLIRGQADDDPRQPQGRIRNTHKLLTSAALIMSLLLLTSSLVTTLLIPAAEFQEGGQASGRALAYLAHALFGSAFGSLYDLSTIAILWFAGASAMAGLLNIVPRYLPRYGMAPDWTRATRPLVLIFSAICLLVTLLFRASVNAQASAYATGVLALMTSATVAVTLSALRRRQRGPAIYFSIITLIFIYTTAVTIKEQPDGLQIALAFILSIIIFSLISRVFRSTELRLTTVVIDEATKRFLAEASAHGPLRIIANHPDERDSREYLLKERESREENHIPSGDPVLFFEVDISDASEFAPTLVVKGVDVGGYRILRAESPSVPNALAAFLLHIRDLTGQRPHAYFGWVEGNPISYLARFIFFGEGDVAPVTREILRKAEPDPTRRPAIHVG